MRPGLTKAATRLFPFPITPWPNLIEFLHHGRIDEVDLGLAEMLLKQTDCYSEAVAFLLCHLSLAARQGHMCISIEGCRLAPSVMECWSGSDPEIALEPLSLHDCIRIQAYILRGLIELPQELLGVEGQKEGALYFHAGKLYLQRYWHIERELLNETNRIQQATPKPAIDDSAIATKLKQMQSEGLLLPEQALAIQTALQSSLMFLSGGPGTGKTYTAGHLIRLFWEALPPERRTAHSIALAAPTGKAAAALQASLQRALKTVDQAPQLTTQTLHGLLGLKGTPSLNSPAKFLAADLILIDESSMIDAQLFTLLLKSVRKGARLLFLGDPFQLPPIHTGAPFAHLLERQKDGVKIPHIHLKQCLRAELKDIVSLAESIRQGDHRLSLSYLKKSNSSAATRWISWKQSELSIQQLHKNLLTHSSPLFPTAHYTSDDQLNQLIQAYQSYRLLSPLRQGVFGVNALNHLFLNHALSQVENNCCVALPIIVTRNDLKLGLFNGECGLLLKTLSNSREIYPLHPNDLLLLPNPSQPGSFRKLPAILAPAFELAYCLSVHKSQGSEFDTLLLLLPFGSERFGKELLYTAVTRAKRGLDIWCQNEELFTKLIQKSCQRISGLRHL